MDFWSIILMIFAAALVGGFVETAAQRFRRDLQRIEEKLDRIVTRLDGETSGR